MSARQDRDHHYQSAVYRYYEMTNNPNGSPKVGEEKEVSIIHRGYFQTISISTPQPQLFLPQKFNSNPT